MALAPSIAENKGGAIGRPSPRADAAGKVRGEAAYAVEHNPDGVLQGFPVLAHVATGRIFVIHTEAAEATPGVVAVLTHLNAPAQAPQLPADADFFARLFGPKPVLNRDEVMFHGQYVALVVADTYETARAAAALVRVEVEGAEPMLDFDAALAGAYTPKTINGGEVPDTTRGDVDAAMARAAFTVAATYDTPYEHANAMEPHGAVAEWKDGRLHVWDTAQAVSVTAASLCATFGLKPEEVRVESRFVGGGFGSKFGLRPHVVLAALGAKVTGRPVKVALTRQHSFTDYGHRSRVRQRMRLGADAQGRLAAFAQEVWVQTSVDDEFVEQAGSIGRVMYAAPDRLSRHRVAVMHTPTPAYMRAPGETPGSFAVESAMDELAHLLNLDPIALRLANEPETNPETGKPWTSRLLVRCLEEGARRFGWEGRRGPGETWDGRWRVGMGVAAGSYPYRDLPASARLTLASDGGVRIGLAAADIGTGAYTILRQIAAEALGLREGEVEIDLGDSDLPMTLGAAGSSGTASWGSAIMGAVDALRERLSGLARTDADSPFHASATALTLSGGLLGDGLLTESVTELIGRAAPNGFSLQYDHQPDMQPPFDATIFSAQFAEVGVHADTGEVRVRRLLGAFDVGRVVNPRTANSQMIGGMTMGVGQALMEETRLDPRWGQWTNRDLGEYHVPVNADIPQIEAFWLDVDDAQANPLGAKGVGEISIVGVAAAIANAVFNASGVRVRDLPITVEKVLAGLDAPEAGR